MTIQNRAMFEEGFWDWAIFDGCFGNTRIRPSDVDGMVERNGEFLAIETKRPGANIPTGQFWMYCALAERPGMTVLILWGDPGNPEEMMVMDSYNPPEKMRCTLEDVREFVRNWFRAAETKPNRWSR